MWKHVRNITLIFIALALAGVWYITRPDVAQLPLDAVTGPKPNITEGREQISRPLRLPRLTAGKPAKHQPLRRV